MSSITAIAQVGASAARIAEMTPASTGTVVSLEQRLIQGFAEGGVGVERDQAAINAMLSCPDITNTEVLAELQVRMADYNLDVNLLNTLVRKAVATAETLLRSS